jgi:hypothetical protein
VPNVINIAMMPFVELQVLWALDGWRCVYNGTTLVLYVERLQVSRRLVENVRDRDRIAEGWRRSVQAIVDLEWQEAHRARAR